MVEHSFTPLSNSPHSKDAELSFLGAVLVDPRVLREVDLEPDQLYFERNRIVFRAMREVDARNEPLDILTIRHQLSKTGELKQAGGAAYIAELSSHAVTAVSAAHHAKIIAEKAKARALIAFGREIVAAASKDSEDLDAEADKIASRAIELSAKTGERQYSSLDSALKSSLDALEQAIERKRQGGISGVTSGFVKLDRMTGGFQPGQLIILAARPGMGKTALALNVSTAAGRSQTPAGFFSMEMSREELAMRIWGSEALVPVHKLDHHSEAHSWESAFGGLTNARTLPVYLDDTAGQSITTLSRRARQMKADLDIGLLVVDYLQLMSGSANTAKSGREQQISEISRGLKMLAKELKIPVIALSQLNRGLEYRDDKRPMLADLRESGAIEQDADIIMFLYRESYYDSEATDERSTELIVAKHRNGENGTVMLDFHAPVSLFTNAPSDTVERAAPEFESDDSPDQ